jgi:DNA (cytosine-5)-methyltransferase 1
MGAGKTVDEWDAWTDTMLATTTAGNGHGPSLSVEAIRPGWGRYAEAVHRWEHLTRPAPEPTELGPEGPWLSARFVEWMMGLPDAYVTGVSNVSRSAMLRLLGNGVVPQQAAEAVRRLLAV